MLAILYSVSWAKLICGRNFIHIHVVISLLIMEEEVYLEILAKLSNQERVIIKSYHASELQAVKMELEVLKVKYSSELEVLKVKYESVNKELANANWGKVSKTTLIDVRGFLDYFDRNKLNQQIFDRKERFAAFAKEKEKGLKKWRLTIRSFDKAFQNLYRKVNASAHPVFTSAGVLIITKNNLEPCELQTLGFLWDKFPLPRKTLYVKYPNDKLCNVFQKYRN